MSALAESLPRMDHGARIERLRSVLAEARSNGDRCDALLVTHLTNVRYLSGFTGSAGLLLLLPEEVVFVTDGRYGAQAERQLAGLDVRIEISADRQREIISGAVRGGMGSALGSALGFEGTTIGWDRHRTYATEWFEGVDLVPTFGLVEDLRIVKDNAEIERIRLAAAIADTALASLRRTLADGPTEEEFGLALDTEMRRLGASGPSFETIVASGPNSAVPHHRPTSRHITDGDLVVLDFGALLDGYCSDMTRTVLVGDGSDAQHHQLDVVLAAQAAGVDRVVAGVDTSDVDAACREVIEAAGWGERFTHGTGHGVGLDIHEAPRVARTSGDTLAAGQVVTVEPGVYLTGVGGVRIEDSVVVTADGCVPLTLTPKDPSIGLSWQPSPLRISRTEPPSTSTRGSTRSSSSST